MTRDQIKDMVLAILGQADYDLMKGYMPETAEDPEYAAESLEGLIDTAEKYLRKAGNLSKKANK